MRKMVESAGNDPHFMSAPHQFAGIAEMSRISQILGGFV